MHNNLISIASYNCNGLADSCKRKEVWTWLHDKKSYGIICLQETHSVLENEKIWEKEWGGPMFFSHGSKSKKGVIILIESHIQYMLHSVRKDTEGRWILIDISIDELRCSILNIYAPNNDDAFFFEEITSTLNDCPENVLIVGDFNLVLNADMDRQGASQYNYHPKAFKVLSECIASLDLVDIWRLRNPGLRRYTWRRNKQASRIDFFLISFALVGTVSQTKILDRFRSDHALITLQLTTSESPRGRGYWKLNQQLLNDCKFIENTKSFISMFFENNVGTADPHMVWDAFKCVIRGHIIKWSSWTKKKRLEKENRLGDEIDKLNQELDKALDPPIDMLILLKDKQYELERLYSEKVNGVIQRSKAIWMEKGEKCTAFFLRLNNRNNHRKNITKLLSEMTCITSPEQILAEQVNYFREMYSFNQQPVSLTELNCSNFFPENAVKLNVTQRASCEGLITEEELLLAINSFQTGKSPGLDGICMEFYKVFYEEIRGPLLTCFNYSYETGELSPTQREGLISLLLKQDGNGKDKDPLYLKNWRPLTLLCCDARILSKCLALRIKKVISYIIKTEQSGFIAGRYIGDNIRHVLEIIEYYEKECREGLLFVADFEKAFDKIRWDYIRECLQKVNFGHSFLKWFNVLYNNPRSKVTNYGYLSDSFELLRGVRQGCPLSPYLFIIVIETLANRIRNNNNILGLTINGFDTKISLYADDATFFIQPKQTVLAALMEDLNSFSLISGLKPNYEKCTILKIGAIKYSNMKLHCSDQVKWSNGPVNMLGITIPENMAELTKVNFNKKIIKMDKILMPWYGKSLSLYGKVTLINTLVVSQFVYLFQSLPSPDQGFYKIYETKIFKFLWNGKPERIKRKYIYNSHDRGGFGLTNIYTLNQSLKASWIQKAYQNRGWAYCKILENRHPLFKTNLFPFIQLEAAFFSWFLKEYLKNVSIFTNEAIMAWLHFQYHPPEGPNDILSQILWLNSNILIEGKPLFFPTLIKNGIIFVNDLIDPKGSLYDFNTFCKIFGKLCTLFEYNQLCAAVPVRWKKGIHNTDRLLVCRPCIREYKWLNKCKINKAVYTHVLHSRKLTAFPHKFCNFWENQFDTPIDWNKVFNLIYITTVDSKLRMLQIKIIYKYLPTKKMLNIWGIEESGSCRFCSAEEEDLLHLFWYCPVVAHFWETVHRWIGPSTKNFRTSPDIVLLGDLKMGGNGLNNIVILLAKAFIFRSQNMNELNPTLFKKYVKQYYMLEAIIAGDESDRVTQKWENLILRENWN